MYSNFNDPSKILFLRSIQFKIQFLSSSSPFSSYILCISDYFNMISEQFSLMHPTFRIWFRRFLILVIFGISGFIFWSGFITWSGSVFNSCFLLMIFVPMIWPWSDFQIYCWLESDCCFNDFLFVFDLSIVIWYLLAIWCSGLVFVGVWLRFCLIFLWNCIITRSKNLLCNTLKFSMHCWDLDT